MQSLWECRYALRMKNMTSSAIRELLKITGQPGVISFGGGYPAPEVFPVDEFAEACSRVLKDPQKAQQALQYGPSEGYYPLREMIARHTNRYGINITPEHVLITSGSQQALDLIGKVFINPGDHILVESPTYLGALQAWAAYNAEYITVPSDDEGIRIDMLEEALRRGPKFMYLLPNFQNPTGVTIPENRRRAIVELAEQYGVPIVEDDPYGQLRYEGEHIPPVSVIDDIVRREQNNPNTGNAIYMSTFSKTLAPGLRLAWVLAPVSVINRMVQAKQGMDLHTSTFNQFVAYEVASGGFLDKHTQLIRKIYGERRNAMIESLEEHMPEGVKWTHPNGGLFLWITLPEGVSATDMFKKAVAQKVAFVPGAPFHATGGGENTMRLNFSAEKPEVINEGIARLGRVLREELAK